MVEVVRYEAKWFANSEWEECSQKDYHDIVTSVRDGSTYPNGTGPKARALGVITDEGGLLLIGPPGYDSWRDAAIKEKMQRVEFERELKTVREENERLQGLAEVSYDAERDAVHSSVGLEQKLKEIRAILDRE
uniref:Uncharacterized protein n=1 Tax=Pseudomonas phage HRDY3 TaxID=3236930 RepID=A0AB39CE13_9VIRU